MKRVDTAIGYIHANKIQSNHKQRERQRQRQEVATSNIPSRSR